MTQTWVEKLSQNDCLDLVSQVPVGRIAITVGALPVILPVNFAIHGRSVIFRTVPGTKLSAATANNVVAFEVDHYENDGRAGWSVLVQGIAVEVVDPELVKSAIAELDEPWGVAEVADRIVRIDVEMVSGRRFRRGGH
jgi:nitroimidazol reductase NimA-like FMN-containing flavoprotein (pyridoxamine 5'-phosphate oxidase superfamily)